MKYSVNHPYKFSNYKYAFLAGFLQASMILIVEVSNFLVILCNTQIMQIVMDFIALAIIAEFDNFYYDSLQQDELKNLIEEDDLLALFLIEHTTSREAKADVDSNKFVSTWIEDESKMKLHIGFWNDRNFVNKVLYLLYKLFRFMYVSFWFYFMPFAALLGTYLIPAFYKSDNIIIAPEA